MQHTRFTNTLLLCVFQALGCSSFPAVLRQLLPLVKPRGGEDECGPDELISLLIFLYSLADEAQPADQHAEEQEVETLEKELIGALTLVITSETELSPLLQKLTGEPAQSQRGDCFQQQITVANGLRGTKRSENSSCLLPPLCVWHS